jgi:hypothetical protein
MSLYEKRKHNNKGESKAHSLMHRYDFRKMASVVNHVHFERHHGFESTKHRERKA